MKRERMNIMLVSAESQLKEAQAALSRARVGDYPAHSATLIQAAFRHMEQAGSLLRRLGYE